MDGIRTKQPNNIGLGHRDKKIWIKVSRDKIGGIRYGKQLHVARRFR